MKEQKEFNIQPNVKFVQIDKLVKSPYWTREFAKDEDFKELVESIKKHGVSENLLARWKEHQLELVYGHRRWYAAREAGLSQVPVKIEGLSDEEAWQFQLEENLKRKNLKGIEIARHLQNGKEKFGYSHEDLAKHFGKDKSWVTRHLQMLDLEKVAPGQLISQDLTERQAREIRKLPEEKQKEILQKPQIPSAREIERETQEDEYLYCERCAEMNMRTQVKRSEAKPFGRYNVLCTRCYSNAVKHPEHFSRKPKTAKPKPQVKEYKPVEAWKDREARMHPQHSKMEDALLLKLHEADVRPTRDHEFCVQSTTPDFYFPAKQTAVYVDGPVHEGKEDRDEAIREKLAKRHGVHVVSIAYKADTETERERVFNEIKQAIGKE